MTAALDVAGRLMILAGDEPFRVEFRGDIDRRRAARPPRGACARPGDARGGERRDWLRRVQAGWAGPGSSCKSGSGLDRWPGSPGPQAGRLAAWLGLDPLELRRRRDPGDPRRVAAASVRREVRLDDDREADPRHRRHRLHRRPAGAPAPGQRAIASAAWPATRNGSAGAAGTIRSRSSGATCSTAPRSARPWRAAAPPITWSTRCSPASARSASATTVAARNFAEAAEAAGLERVIYLGGLGRRAEKLSPHLASRHEVGDVLRGGRCPSPSCGRR